MSRQSEHLKRIIIKIERYCAYQDRCEYEVRKKLKPYTLSSEQTDFILDRLIESSFLDETRFAESYVHGKLKVKKWGRIKIKSKLIEKRVSSKLIEEALSGINDNLYQETIKELIVKKQEQLQSKNLSASEEKQKISQYLLSKGFEWSEISTYLFD